MISEELEERIDRALGYPTHDPHGDPIPDANLEWPQTGEAPERLSLDWPTLAKTGDIDHGAPFSFLFARSRKEDLVAEHVIREHHRGRSLDDILDDAYVTNRLSPEQVDRLLDRPEVVHAVRRRHRRRTQRRQPPGG